MPATPKTSVAKQASSDCATHDEEARAQDARLAAMKQATIMMVVFEPIIVETLENRL